MAVDKKDNLVRKEDIDEAIIKLCLKIIQEPLLYFSEADVQQLLVEELHKIKPLARIYPTKVPRGEDSKGKYQTSLVHREYGAGNKKRHDVVIFDRGEVAQIDDVNLTKNKGEYLPPAYVFELGTEKAGNTRDHFEKDIEKLKAGTKKGGCGYLIHLYKDSTRRPSGLSRDRTEKKIKGDFKDVFNGFKDNANNLHLNIKVLAILLRIGRQGKWIRGKCEIFDVANGEWPPINIQNKSDICNALRDQLKGSR